MLALFYAGCGLSLLAAGAAPNLIVLACALFALGIFAAIYHPVGTAMLIGLFIQLSKNCLKRTSGFVCARSRRYRTDQVGARYTSEIMHAEQIARVGPRIDRSKPARAANARNSGTVYL